MPRGGAARGVSESAHRAAAAAGGGGSGQGVDDEDRREGDCGIDEGTVLSVGHRGEFIGSIYHERLACVIFFARSIRIM